MKFVCDNCNTKYSIADEKVRRKVLKIRCKNCNHIVVVRDPHRSQHRRKSSGASALDQAFERSFQEQSALRVSGSRSPIKAVPSHATADRPDPEDLATAISPPTPEDGLQRDEWYLAVDGHQFGPMSFDELCKRVKRGEARGDSGDEAFVWHDGFDDWIEVTSVPELRPYVPPPPPPRGRSGLFSSEALPPSAPPPPVEKTPPPSPRRMGLAAVPAPAPALVPSPSAGVREEPAPATPESSSGLLAVGAGAAVQPSLTPEIPVPAVPGQPRSASTPWSMRIAVAGALVSMAMGIVLMVYVFSRDQPAAPTAPTLSRREESEIERRVVPVRPSPEDDVVAEGDDGDSMAFSAMEIKHSAGRRGGGARTPRPIANASAGAATEDDGLSEEERRILKRFKGGDSVDVGVPVEDKKKTVLRSRNITQAEVARLQMSNKRYIQACYNRALKRDYSLRDTKAEVTLTVSTSGRVTGVRFSGITSEVLTSCLRGNLRRWVFRPLGGTKPGEVNFSLLFRGS